MTDDEERKKEEHLDNMIARMLETGDALEAMRSMAAGVAAYWKELIDQDVPPDVATMLTSTLVQSMAIAIAASGEGE